MTKRADEPICPNRHCQEDAEDMIDVWVCRTFIEYCCRTCGQHWRVAKPPSGES